MGFYKSPLTQAVFPQIIKPSWGRKLTLCFRVNSSLLTIANTMLCLCPPPHLLWGHPQEGPPEIKELRLLLDLRHASGSTSVLAGPCRNRTCGLTSLGSIKAVVTRHMWLLKFKCKLYKLKYVFLSHISHISRAQWIHVASGYCAGQHRYRTFQTLQKVLLDIATGKLFL